jgi:hypothetical protein
MIEIHWPASGATPQPITFAAPSGASSGETLGLRASGKDEAGEPLPVVAAQRLADGHFVALVTPRAGGHRYDLTAAPSRETEVTAREVEGNRVELKVGDSLFGFYHFDRSLARPFLYPVHGPDGVVVTRHYPMREVVGEARDHPHHRSFWTAYGEVNDSDNWSEEKGHAFVRHQEFVSLFSGPVCGGFTARNRWVDNTEQPQLEEIREVRIYSTGLERRLIDYTVTFIAGEKDVRFGDTKEGGLISFRVATPMDGSRGGRIENAAGGRGERECWGKPSPWCDYSGTVEGRPVGIAVMDHLENLRHPVRWHVRDYGLMTANPFGTSTFEGEAGGRRGEYTLKAGQSLRFRYRVLLHRGDAGAGRVPEAWEAFARPGTARAVET